MRKLLLAFFALAPVLAFAQQPDSIHVKVEGIEYPAYGARFGPPFPAVPAIMDTLAVTEPGTACRGLPDDGTEGLILNPEEIEGKIALIERGGGYFNNCPFITKVQAAQDAGAVAVVVYNYDSEMPDYILAMEGDCAACIIPAAFVSRNSGLAILDELMAGSTTATIAPVPAIPSSTDETAPEGTYVLESAYPNPFTDRATISFALPRAQNVRLAVYDVLGREVAVLADGARTVGEQTVAFDASALPSGVYLVRLEAGSVRLVEQVTVVR